MKPEHRLQRFEKRTEWPLAIAASVFLAAYSVEVIGQPTGGWAKALDAVMVITWALFVVDYAARLYLAPHRPRWFVRHLLDLAIVALPLLRPLRLLRLVVLLAALQKAIGGAIRGRVILYTASSAVLLVYAGSLAILQAERGHPGARITTFGDAVWWSMSTVTTVGYGDESPVTGEGRVVAVLMMVGGIGLVGAVTATLASWVVQRVAREDTEHQAATAAHIEALRADAQKQFEELHGEIARLANAVTAQHRHTTAPAAALPQLDRVANAQSPTNTS
jgi:voltage-gated potassium channel